MDVFDVFARRRSIRSYLDKPVSDEQLMKIAGAAQLAPSACNRQPWKLVAVRSPEVRQAIFTACPQRFLPEAPVILAAVGNTAEAWRRGGDDHSLVEVDVGIMFEHVTLAAAALGLGTCWVAAYDVKKMNAALGVESPWRVLAISPLGYAAKEAAPLIRKELNSIFEIR